MCREKRLARSRRRLPGQFERRVGAGEAHLHAGLQVDVGGGHGLADEVVACFRLQQRERLSRGRFAGCVERAFDRAPPDRATAGQPYAIGRQHAGERMQQHFPGAEQLGDGARVLARGAAETQQPEAGRILAVVQGEFANRVRHASAGHLQEGIGQRLHGVAGPGLVAGGRREVGEACAGGQRIDRLVTGRAEDMGKAFGWNASEHDVAVGDRRGSVASIARRPWVGARRGRTDLQAAVGETQQRAAARRDRLDVHERRLQPDAVDLGGEAPRDRASRETDVCRRPAHVEADESARTVRRAGRNHAHDAARGPGQHAVHAAEAVRVHQAAIALHERDGGLPVRQPQARAECPRIAQQYWRQVGVGHRGVAAGHVPEQGCRFMRGDDFVEAGFPRDGGGPDLVRWMTKAVEEGDRHRFDPGLARRPQGAAQRVLIEWRQHAARRIDALGDLGHIAIQGRRTADRAREDVGAFLVTDQERIPHSLRSDEQGRRARAFEQRVGGHGGSEPDRVHAVAVRVAVLPEQHRDSTQRRVARLVRIVRKHLAREQRPVGGDADDVGKGPAPVHREPPAVCHAFFNVRQSNPTPVRRNLRRTRP